VTLYFTSLYKHLPWIIFVRSKTEKSENLLLGSIIPGCLASNSALYTLVLLGVLTDYTYLHGFHLYNIQVYNWHHHVHILVISFIAKLIAMVWSWLLYTKILTLPLNLVATTKTLTLDTTFKRVSILPVLELSCVKHFINITIKYNH